MEDHLINIDDYSTRQQGEQPNMPRLLPTPTLDAATRARIVSRP
jgi:hypothetical protein